MENSGTNPSVVKKPFPTPQEKLWLLREIGFGARVAEEEPNDLADYFVETNTWRDIFAGKIDVVYGAKGSGKSALYALLMARRNKLEERDILLAPAENPRGTPVFRDLVTDPPFSENEFIGLWMLYFASILYSKFREMDFSGKPLDRIGDALRCEGLLEESGDLKELLHSIWSYVRRILRGPDAFTGSLEIDPISGLPKGVSGKISFSNPSVEEAKRGRTSVDQLLAFAKQALQQNGKFHVWILLDRLDVAFQEHPNLEANALKALFRVYLDLRVYEYFELKIFLRSDVWMRVTKEGFREASHVTRAMYISWDYNSLLNLVVRRLLFNEAIRNHYKVDSEQVLRSTEDQERFFYSLFSGKVLPNKTDAGRGVPKTFDWMLVLTKDGIGNAPREMIHLLTAFETRKSVE